MSFAKLFRNSRFVALDRLGRQVITAPKHLRAKGEWGLKSNLPKDIRTPVITVKEHSDTDGTLHYFGAFEQVSAVERWKEIFPLPEKSFPLPKILEEEFLNEESENSKAYYGGLSPDEIELIEEKRAQMKPIDLSKATEEEYQEILKRAWLLRKVFKKLVDQGKYISSQWPTFLKIVNPIKTSRWGTRSESKHPPVYRTKPADHAPQPVKGRILNTLHNGAYAVGIAGFVAYLPKNEVEQYHARDRLTLMDFYILKASINSDGKPEIIVSAKPPLTEAGNYHSTFIKRVQQRQNSAFFNEPMSSKPRVNPSSSNGTWKLNSFSLKKR